MRDHAIFVHNVSKRYKLYENAITGPVKEYLFFWKKEKLYQEFWAVRDVTFEIKKGEVVGIIGPNGAGKSTVLKMIAGLLRPDKGEIVVGGDVTALLTLGVGFHPEFTGRENILYGGMLLGMSKKEVLGKMDSIIEFSELGDYIDRPFRTYSSGMKARLIFSTSMSINPEILIVDEALATGDSYFVQKCSERIHEICRNGATILFVSHNLLQIKRICQRAILMNEGRVVIDAVPDRAIAQYHHLIFNKEKRSLSAANHKGLEMVGGTGEVVLNDVRLLNENSEPDEGFYSGEGMKIELHYERRNEDIKEINLFIGFLDYKKNIYVGEINTFDYINSSLENVSSPIKIHGKGVITVSIKPIILVTKQYSIWIALYSTDDYNYYSEYRNVKPFFISRKGRSYAIAPEEYFKQVGDFGESAT